MYRERCGLEAWSLTLHVYQKYKFGSGSDYKTVPNSVDLLGHGIASHFADPAVAGGKLNLKTNEHIIIILNIKTWRHIDAVGGDITLFITLADWRRN